MAREEDLKRSGAWDWLNQRPAERSVKVDLSDVKAKDQSVVIFSKGEAIYISDAESIILSLAEEYYGSGKAMQVADIVKEGE